MSPRQQGRHCAECDHVVADLTTATDAQLVALFTSDAKPMCARFDPQQLDRALGAAEQQRSITIPVAAFTSLLAIASGSGAIAQQGIPMMVGEPAIAQPPPPQAMGKAMFVAQPKDSTITCSIITGDTVATIFHEPDPILERIETGNVAISMEGLVKGDGEPAPAGNLVHDRTEIHSAAVAVDMPEFHYENVPTSDPGDGEGPLGIAGFVEDVRTGRMLPEAIIQLSGTHVRVRCNGRGYFGLLVPEEMIGQELILDIHVPGSGEMALPLPPKGTPFYAPIKFRPDNPVPIEPVATIDLSPFVIERERQPATLEGICVIRYEVPPTFWQRILAPIKRGWNNVRH